MSTAGGISSRAEWQKVMQAEQRRTAEQRRELGALRLRLGEVEVERDKAQKANEFNQSYVGGMRRELEKVTSERNNAVEERDAARLERDEAQGRCRQIARDNQRSLDAETEWIAALREKHGAHDDEGFPEFIDRLWSERNHAQAYINLLEKQAVDLEAERDGAMQAARDLANWPETTKAWEQWKYGNEASQAELAELRERTTILEEAALEGGYCPGTGERIAALERLTKELGVTVGRLVCGSP